MSPNFFQDLWELAKTAGPFATLLMIFLWLRCDKERRDNYDKILALNEKIVGIYESRLLQSAESGRALAQATNAMESVAKVVEKLTERVSPRT